MQTMLWITALLLPAATLPGCDRGRDAAGPESAVRIGFLAAGDRASYVDAAGIAVDEINEAGGLLGRTVELVARSGIEEPAASVQAAEEMILDDGVIALVGPNRSSHAVVVAETAQRHGLPMITTSATNPEVTRRPAATSSWRPSPISSRGASWRDSPATTSAWTASRS